MHSIHTAIRQYNLQFETAFIYHRVKFQKKIPIFQDNKDNSRSNYRFSRTRMNPVYCLTYFLNNFGSKIFYLNAKVYDKCSFEVSLLRSRRLLRCDSPARNSPGDTTPVLRSSTRRLETISWAGARPSRLSCFVSCFRRYLFQIGPGAGERENNLCHQTDRN